MMQVSPYLSTIATNNGRLKMSKIKTDICLVKMKLLIHTWTCTTHVCSSFHMHYMVNTLVSSCIFKYYINNYCICILK